MQTSEPKTRRISKLAWTLVIPLLFAVPPLRAQTAPPKPDGWQFEITPYLWGCGLDGNLQAGQLASAGVEASFSDLFSVLDMGLMAAFEGRRDRWGFATNVFYVKLSDTVAAPDPQFGNVETELVQDIFGAAATYRVVEGKTAVDVLFGARYASLEPELTLSGGVAAGRSKSGKESWWDGVVGTRVLYRPGEHWSIMGYADVGAGGEDVSYQLAAGAGYDFKKVVGLRFGYRYLHFDYDNGTFAYDMAMAGPYFGVGFRF